MAEPFLSEIRFFSFGFAPRGWAQCNGQLLPINQNQALFALLGTTYGGNGTTNFALPDFRGRVPVHQSSGYPLGQRAGVEAVALQQQHLPPHRHGIPATSAPATTTNPQGAVPAIPAQGRHYGTDASVPMSPDALGSVGGAVPHDNVQPFLAITFCIALQGIFPSQN